MSLLLLLSAAWAADEYPLLHTDSKAVAVENVSNDSQVPVWQLQPSSLGDSFKGSGITAVGSNQPKPCTGDAMFIDDIIAVNALVESMIADPSKKNIVDVSARFSEADLNKAKKDLDEGLGMAVCLSEPGETEILSRLYYLHGAVHAALGDKDTAYASFRQAIFFNKKINWDPLFPNGWRAMFDKALAKASQNGRLVRGEGLENVTIITIDGENVDISKGYVDLPQGPHFLQVIGDLFVTLQVNVVEGEPVALINAEALGGDLITQAADPNKQGTLQAMINTAFPDSDTVYVWTGKETARLVGKGWEVLPRREASGGSSGSSLAGNLRVAGGVSIGVGVLASAAGMALWAPNKDGKGAKTPEEFTQMTNKATTGSALFSAGLISIGVGAASAGTGIFMENE